MAIWFKPFTLEQLQASETNTAAAAIGVRFTAFGDDWLEATVPLDPRTRNASGSVAGGALAILGETVGSVAANMCIDLSRNVCLGQTLAIDHLRPATSGPIRARAVPIAILEKTQLWNVELTDPDGSKICVVRLTMAAVPRHVGVTA
jgi:1,4-dihydroxy-2-naphthoyl-CoA hydrolase